MGYTDDAWATVSQSSYGDVLAHPLMVDEEDRVLRHLRDIALAFRVQARRLHTDDPRSTPST